MVRVMWLQFPPHTDCVAVLLNLNTLQGWLNAHPGSVKEINVYRYHMHICMDVLDVQNVCTSRICVCERLDIPIPSISMSSIPIYLSCICLYVIICLCRSIKVSHQQKATASSRRPGCALPKNRCSRARHRHL